MAPARQPSPENTESVSWRTLALIAGSLLSLAGGLGLTIALNTTREVSELQKTQAAATAAAMGQRETFMEMLRNVKDMISEIKSEQQQIRNTVNNIAVAQSKRTEAKTP